MSSEVREMNSADAMVENTVIDDTDRFTELINEVRNYNESFVRVNIFFCLGCGFNLCHR